MQVKHIEIHICRSDPLMPPPTYTQIKEILRLFENSISASVDLYDFLLQQCVQQQRYDSINPNKI